MKMNGLSLSLAIASACLVLAPAAFAAPQAKGAQIPNPMVNYDSYADAAKVLGYAPPVPDEGFRLCLYPYFPDQQGDGRPGLCQTGPAGHHPANPYYFK